MEWFGRECLKKHGREVPKGVPKDMSVSLSRNDWNKSVLITERQPKRLLKKHRGGIPKWDPKWDGMGRERMPKEGIEGRVQRT